MSQRKIREATALREIRADRLGQAARQTVERYAMYVGKKIRGPVVEARSVEGKDCGYGSSRDEARTGVTRGKLAGTIARDYRRVPG